MNWWETQTPEVKSAAASARSGLELELEWRAMDCEQRKEQVERWYRESADRLGIPLPSEFQFPETVGDPCPDGSTRTNGRMVPETNQDTYSYIVEFSESRLCSDLRDSRDWAITAYHEMHHAWAFWLQSMVWDEMQEHLDDLNQTPPGEFMTLMERLPWDKFQLLRRSSFPPGAEDLLEKSWGWRIDNIWAGLHRHDMDGDGHPSAPCDYTEEDYRVYKSLSYEADAFAFSIQWYEYLQLDDEELEDIEEDPGSSR